MKRKDDNTSTIDPWRFIDFALELPAITQAPQICGISADHILPRPEDIYGLFKFPDLDNFRYGPIETPSTKTVSVASIVTNHLNEEDNTLDIWTAIPLEVFDASEKNKTWELFGNHEFEDSKLYLSETTQETWNAAWARFDAKEDDFKTLTYVRHDYVLRCLIDFGLGLNSTLFAFGDGGSFSICDSYVISGLSRTLSMSLARGFGLCGRNFRAIEQFSKTHYHDPTSFRTTIAVISAVNQSLSVIREEISNGCSEDLTILKLQSIFRTPSAILQKFRELFGELEECSNENETINHLLHVAELHESYDQWYRPIMLQILRIVSQSTLDTVSQAIALDSRTIYNTSHNANQEIFIVQSDTLFSLRPMLGDLPALFDVEQQLTIANISQCLQILDNHYQRFPLNEQLLKFNDNGHPLSLGLSWDDLNRIHGKALALESSIRQILPGDLLRNVVSENLSKSNVQRRLDLNPYGADIETLEENVYLSSSAWDSLPSQANKVDELSTTVALALRATSTEQPQLDLEPPVAVLKSASFTPTLILQSRLVNRACLGIIFKDYKLLHNLDFLHDFHLLGSGLFASRLKQALFSPELSSAERRKGRHRLGQLGLRLGSRTSWPPASAELRLALMGILADCYRSRFPESSNSSSNSLPGNTAFAIRNLTEPEIEACMNPASVAALDFLCLQYQPSKALATVISESTLKKYDQIFRFLLRLNRVSFAINQMWTKQRNNKDTVDTIMARFIFEARHFIETLTLYVHTAITTSWLKFREIIAKAAKQIDIGVDITSSLGHDALYQISSLHDTMLDKVLFDLLLRKRHEKVTQVLEKLLGCILQIVSAYDETPAKNTIGEFQATTKLFISVCRSLSDNSSYVQDDDARLSSSLQKTWSENSASETGLKSFVLALDMNGWYSKHDSGQ